MGSQPVGALSVVGDIALDVYLDVSDVQDTDEKVTATSGRRAVGGTAANAAAAARALGSPVRLFGSVGRDPLGPWLRDALSAQGIDVGGVRAVEGRSTLAVILRSQAGRRVVVDRGIADELDHIDVAVASQRASLVYLSALPARYVRPFLERSPVPLVIGYEWRQRGDLDALGSLLDRAAVIVTNAAGEADLLARATGWSNATLVVTSGADGVAIRTPDGTTERLQAMAVDVVDATGAGDCFAGALCHFLRVGESVARAVRLASVAASISTTAVGAQSHLPTEAEVRAAAERLSVDD